MTLDPEGNLGLGLGGAAPQRTLHVNSVMRLEPTNLVPANPSKGDIFMHRSGAACVFTGQIWEKMNVTGSCP